MSSRRYAHLDCFNREKEKIKKEAGDKEHLEEYIMKMFGESYINPRIRKQIKTYIEEYNYSYSGILKSLTYFFEVKGNSIEKANGGIGIVPYVYQNAYNYYLALFTKTLNLVIKAKQLLCNLNICDNNNNHRHLSNIHFYIQD